jgi:hypothetical protein
MDLATRALFDAPIGVDTVLEPAGSTLENPLVYDSVARALIERAHDGSLEVLGTEVGDIDGQALVTRLRFRRLR